MDWITLSIELIGVFILLLWTVIPAREFNSILKTIRRRNDAAGTGTKSE